MNLAEFMMEMHEAEDKLQDDVMGAFKRYEETARRLTRQFTELPERAKAENPSIHTPEQKGETLGGDLWEPIG